MGEECEGRKDLYNSLGHRLTEIIYAVTQDEEERTLLFEQANKQIRLARNLAIRERGETYHYGGRSCRKHSIAIENIFDANPKLGAPMSGHGPSCCCDNCGKL